MVRSFWLIVLAGTILTGIAAAADEVVNMSGTWVLDPARSTVKRTSPEIPKPNVSIIRGNTGSTFETGSKNAPSEPQEDRIDNLTLAIVQTDGEVQITRRFRLGGQDRTIIQKFALDGSQCFNLSSDGLGQLVSRTHWNKGKLIHTGIETLMERQEENEISVKEEYSISKDGKQLAIISMSVTSQGTTTLKQNFHRQ
jgi:hypothetical protein